MKFLIVNQESTATIFGHTYHLRPVQDPMAGYQDILISDNGSASELLNRHKDVLTAVSFDKHSIKNFPCPLDDIQTIPSGSNILIIRSGGIGDHIMMLPAIKALREQRLMDGNTKLWLATQEDMFPIFQNNPYVDRLLPLPITMDTFLESDYYADFSEPIRKSDFEQQHPTDYYMGVLGIDNSKPINKDPCLFLDGSQSTTINKILKEIKLHQSDRPLALLQWKASVPLRSFPIKQWVSLINRFKNFVFIVAHHSEQAEQSRLEIDEAGIQVHDISRHILIVNDFLTTVSLCDVVISTDSSAYHVAAGFNKPSLTFFGPIHSQLRTCYYPKAISIDANYKGRTCASPCGLHKGDCPEQGYLNTTHSPCLMSIPEDTILAKFEEVIERFLQP